MFNSLSLLEASIINILSKQYPLSALDIIQKMENKYEKHYSRAGMQKALKSLIDKKFLHKNSKYYQLSTDTLIAEKRKIQSILDRYIEAESYHIFQKKEASYFFETLSELDYFWNKVVEQWFNFYPDKRYGFWQKQPFPWFAAMHLDEERRIARNICLQCRDFQTYSVDTTITRQLQGVYTEHENSSMVLVDKKQMRNIHHSFSVFGDHIIETFQPPNIEIILQELTKGDSDSILFSSIIALSQPGSYKVTITKDKRKAEQYRGELLKMKGGIIK